MQADAHDEAPDEIGREKEAEGLTGRTRSGWLQQLMARSKVVVEEGITKLLRTTE